jgi:uncharacterized membrane protein YobD (UPF0266 family)
MTLVGWLIALIAVAGALVLPFSRGAPFVLALTPFANAYGAAASVGALLLRWALLELSGVSIPRSVLVKVAVAIGFLVAALAISLLVANDLPRLVSEGAQWLIGVIWFCALTIGGREPHERAVIFGAIAGGVALAFAHVLMRMFELEVDEFSMMPFMVTRGNNYAALLALVALVMLPAHPAARISTITYLMLASLGVMVAIQQEARAQMVMAAGVIGVVLLLRYMKPRAALLVAGLAGVGVLAVMIVFLRESMFSANSVVSLANFQTNFSNLERLGLILHSLDFFSTHPLGGGLGASSDVFPSSPFTIGSYPTPHNTFAMLIVEIGWLGLVAYAFGVLVLLRTGLRDCLSGEPFGVAALAAVGLSVIDAVFFNGSVSLQFWLLLAFTMGTARADQRRRMPMYFFRAV